MMRKWQRTFEVIHRNQGGGEAYRNSGVVKHTCCEWHSNFSSSSGDQEAGTTPGELVNTSEVYKHLSLVERFEAPYDRRDKSGNQKTGFNLGLNLQGRTHYWPCSSSSRSHSDSMDSNHNGYSAIVSQQNCTWWVYVCRRSQTILSSTLQIVSGLLITHCTRSEYIECLFNCSHWHAHRCRTKSESSSPSSTSTSQESR